MGDSSALSVPPRSPPPSPAAESSPQGTPTPAPRPRPSGLPGPTYPSLPRPQLQHQQRRGSSRGQRTPARRRHLENRAVSDPQPFRHVIARPDASRNRRMTDPAPSLCRSAAEIDEKIISVLRTPLTPGYIGQQVHGFNYVLAVQHTADSPTVFKIGSTQALSQRVQQIVQSCGHVRAEPLAFDSSRRPIRLYQKAESLIHAELANFLHVMPCHTHHREYFQVDEAVAAEVSARWRKFCAMEPWDGQGNLKPVWEHRLRLMQPSGTEERHDEHVRRAERWRAFVEPGVVRQVTHNAVIAWRRCRPWFWQIVCFAQAVLLAFLLPNRDVGLLWVVFVAVCCLTERGGVPAASWMPPNNLKGTSSLPRRTTPRAAAGQLGRMPGAFVDGAQDNVVNENSTPGVVEMREIAPAGLLAPSTPVRTERGEFGQCLARSVGAEE